MSAGWPDPGTRTWREPAAGYDVLLVTDEGPEGVRRVAASVPHSGGCPFLHQPCQDAYEATASTLTGIFADRPGTTVLRRLTAQGRDESDVHEQGSPRPDPTARQGSATRLSPPRSVNDSRA